MSYGFHLLTRRDDDYSKQYYLVFVTCMGKMSLEHGFFLEKNSLNTVLYKVDQL